MALLYVSAVNTAANSVTFSPGDPFGFNASTATSGTIAKMQTPPGSGTYPTTTATRYWMISYYLDNTNPRPQLMRQVNLNPAQAVGEVIENLQVFYDIVTTTATPIVVASQVEFPTTAQLPSIVDAYIIMYARSETTFGRSNQYLRNNLETAVSIRALDFQNPFP